MRVTLIAIGSRGDVQPYVALGIGLQQAGYRVQVATHEPFAAFVQGHGLDFAPLHGDMQAILNNPQWKREKVGIISGLRQIRNAMAPLAHAVVADCQRICQQTDALLLSTLAMFTALPAVQQLGLPACGAFLQPGTPTRQFPAFLFPQLPGWLGPVTGGYNLITYLLREWLIWQNFNHALLAAYRTVYGPQFAHAANPLSQWRQQQRPCLYGYSPLVVPPPADWSAVNHVTGYWFLDDEQWQPPADLVRFLAAGPPPVYIGFGSMTNENPQAMAHTALRALELTGQRGILLTGWGGLQSVDLPSTVLQIDSAPHSWLFPRMAAVVHHGGAGTTGAGFRAGVPSLVVPFRGDQPFWGQRAQALGVGPAPILHTRLTAERLAHAIDQAVHDQTMRSRAAHLGQRIRAEDGVAHAVAAFQRLLPGQPAAAAGAPTRLSLVG
ncbi:MAG: glycosyltransferase [Chloroflexaceae bacterium]|nr:glycosyltransferase [Chloroflexaceae bacterium]